MQTLLANFFSFITKYKETQSKWQRDKILRDLLLVHRNWMELHVGEKKPGKKLINCAVI